jgi:hypothetical protein
MRTSLVSDRPNDHALLPGRLRDRHRATSRTDGQVSSSGSFGSIIHDVPFSSSIWYRTLLVAELIRLRVPT